MVTLPQSSGLVGLWEDQGGTNEPSDGAPPSIDDEGVPQPRRALPNRVAAQAARPGRRAAQRALPARRAGRRVAVAVVAGVIGAALLAGGIAWFQSATPNERVVAAYLDAIRAGDSRAALTLLAQPPTDTTFITDQVLAGSQQTAPLTVQGVTSTASGEVTAQVWFGDTPATLTFPTVTVAGEPRIVAGTVTLTPPAGPAVHLSGQLVDQPIQVLPGLYRPDGPGTWLTWPAAVADRVAGTVQMPDPAVTGVGEEAAVTAWKARIATCLAMRALTNPRCPFGFTLRPGWTVEKRTIRWSLTNDPWSGLGSLSVAGPGTVTGEVQVAAQVTARYRKAGQVVTRTDPYRVDVTMAADLTQEQPVTSWRRR